MAYYHYLYQPVFSKIVKETLGDSTILNSGLKTFKYNPEIITVKHHFRLCNSQNFEDSVEDFGITQGELPAGSLALGGPTGWIPTRTGEVSFSPSDELPKGTYYFAVKTYSEADQLDADGNPYDDYYQYYEYTISASNIASAFKPTIIIVE